VSVFKSGLWGGPGYRGAERQVRCARKGFLSCSDLEPVTDQGTGKTGFFSTCQLPCGGSPE